MRAPPLGLISLNWNGIRYTSAMLEALLKHAYSGQLTVMIVDNGSKNEEGKRLKEQFGSTIQLYCNKKNEGFAGGNNTGITELLKDPDIQAIVLLNNDTIPDPHFLTSLVETWQKTGADLVAATMRSLDDPTAIDNLGITLTQSLLPFNRKKHELPLFCPSGGCALYSRRLIESLIARDGYFFDPRFFAYAEDLDVGFRARTLGFTSTIANEAIVLHKGSAATKPMSDFAVRHTYRNLIWTLAKNLSFSCFVRWLPKILLGHAGIIAYHTLRGKPHVILRAYGAGLSGVPRFLRERKQTLSLADVRHHTHPRLFA